MRASSRPAALATAVLTVMRRAVTSTLTVRPSAVAPPSPMAETVALPATVSAPLPPMPACAAVSASAVAVLVVRLPSETSAAEPPGATLAVASSL